MEIFVACPPGLEDVLCSEVIENGFAGVATPGGVTFQGDWSDVWRANLVLRGASRVLVRIGAFRALHLAQLDKRSKTFDWSVFHKETPIKVEVTCRKSRIYHAGAAAQRIEGGLQAAGLQIGPGGMTLRARIDDDLCSFSVDSSGELLHKRGHKVAVNKAPMRETLAALLLRACRYQAGEPLIDPMCGSGTFPIEAAEMVLGLSPGRSRPFAFETLASFDPVAYAALRPEQLEPKPLQVFGFDRDQGAIGMSRKNAERAGIQIDWRCQPISDLSPPCETPGLVIVNPPYGGRIGNKKMLYGLYAALGERMRHMTGWRLGMVTSDKGLARATGLEFSDVSAPIPNGGLKVQLYQTAPLG